ncbi:MAG: DUF2339 domain-containing protein [Actinobacteria bacterium]|nr:DUF2339 domain-containing protein [Actinomycetota bacterium]MBU4587766.1 DUF2339 domain-containing protein [Actinomycetota bacterium]
MTEQSDRIRRLQADLVDLSGRLNTLASDFQQLAAVLPAELKAGADATAARPVGAPIPQRSQVPAPPAPPAAPPVYAARSFAPPPPPYVAARPQAPAPVRPAPVRPPAPPRKPRREINIAEIFSIVGSAITLLGVAFVLLLPADGFLSQDARAAIGLGLAVASVLVAVVQHRKEPGNIGSQALMATGVASAFLTVFALSALFRGADGRPLLPELAGIGAAGLISLGGVAVARWWRSQWLAVLAVLGSLVLAPYLGGNSALWPMAFMLVMTLATAAFQHKLDWVGLLLARVVPTALYFSWVLLPFEHVPMVNPLIGLGLAFVLAAGGLGIAVLHQHGSATMRAVAVGSLVALAAPMMLAIWLPDRLLSVALIAVLGLMLAAAGLIPVVFADQVRAAAVPLGASFIALAVVRLTDGDYLGYLFFAMAAAYFAIAASTRFRPVMVVAAVLATIGVWVWLPVTVAAFAPRTELGVEQTAESVLGLISTLLAVRALRAFRNEWGPGLTYLSWAASVGFGSLAVITGGSVIGTRLGDVYSGFQTAHALVTVAWLLLSVLLLRRGLRRDPDSVVAVRLAIALAVAAVAKLFFFDLSTLPDLVRALAFLAVGLVMLFIGTWYHKQLEKGRRTPPAPVAPPAPPAPVSPSPAPTVTAPMPAAAPSAPAAMEDHAST